MSLWQRVATERWAMRPEVLGALVEVVQRHDAGEKLSAEQVSAITNEKNRQPGGWLRGRLEREAAAIDLPVRAGRDSASYAEQGDAGLMRVGSVGVIGIGGVIAKHASSVNGSSQPRGTSVEAIRTALAEALADNAIGSVLRLVESPGGSVSGLATLAQELRSARAGKPVWAYADDLTASAAYWLASQAGRIDASPAAAVGSIGVYAPIADTSKAFEQRGVKVHLVKAGESKGIGTAGVPVTSSDLKVLQAEIDAYYNAFLADVAAGRPTLAGRLADVADGRVWIGQEAQAAGLVDAVRPLADVLREMDSAYSPRAVARGGGPGRFAQGFVDVVAGASGSAVGVGAAAGDSGGKDSAMSAKILADAAGGTGGVGDGSNGQVAGTIPAAAGNGGAAAGGGGGGGNAGTFDQAAAIAEGQRLERARIADITQYAERFSHVGAVKTAADEAIKAGTSADVFRFKALELVAEATRPVGQVNVRVGASGSSRRASAMSLLIAERMLPGLRGKLAGTIGNDEGVADAIRRIGLTAATGRAPGAAASDAMTEAYAEGMQHMRLIDMAKAHLGGRFAGNLPAEEIFAAASNTTSDFPLILQNAANLVGNVKFAETPTTYQLWCRIGRQDDFKTQDLLTLSEGAALRLTPEGQEADLATFNERREQIRLQTFSRAFAWTLQMMVNDSLGLFADATTAFFAAAARLIDGLPYAVLEANANMGDGTALFHSSHNNLEGSAAALSAATLQKQAIRMRTAKGFGPDKAPVSLTPRFLLVPPALQFTAKTVLQSEKLPGGNNNDINPVQNLVEPIVSDKLTNTTAHYLVADPNEMPAVQVNFFRGQRTPQVDVINTGNPLVMKLQFTLLGAAAKAINFEAVDKNPGA